MDGRRFDRFTRAFAEPGSRRSLLRGAFGALVGGLGASVALSRSRAQETDGTPIPPEPAEPTLTPTPTPTATSTPAVEPSPTETPTPVATENAVTATPNGVDATATSTVEATATPTPTGTPGDVTAAGAEGSLSLSKTSGTCQTAVVATVTGFKPNERIGLRWYHGSSSTELKAGRASAGGRAEIAFTVPNATGGGHRVRASGNQGSQADATFTVRSSLTLNRTSGAPGDQVKATFRGNTARSLLDLRWHDGPDRSSAFRVLETRQASAYGTATITFAVPANALGGVHLVVGAQQGSGSRSATFTIPIDGSLSNVEDGAGKWLARYCEDCSNGCRSIPCTSLAAQSPAPRVPDPTGARSSSVLRLGRKAQSPSNFIPYAHVLYGSRVCSQEFPGDPRPCLAVRPGIVQARAFELDLWFMYRPSTGFNNEPEHTRIQAIEFAVALWLNEPTPKVWDFEVQWVCSVGSGDAPRWRLFGIRGDGVEDWIDTGITAPKFAANTWHRLTLRTSIVGSNRARRYDAFAVDGQWQAIDTSKTYAYVTKPEAGGDLAVHVQLDGPLGPPDNYDVFLDGVKVSWYESAPW